MTKLDNPNLDPKKTIAKIRKDLLDYQTITELLPAIVEEVAERETTKHESAEQAHTYRHACCKLTRTLNELEKQRLLILHAARKLDVLALQNELALKKLAK